MVDVPLVFERDHTVGWMGPQRDQEGIQNPDTLLVAATQKK